MISYLKGELAEINSDGAVIDVGGVGYMVNMPAQSIEYLPSVGTEVKIHTYLQVREDAFTLFGFLTADDLSMFKKLLGVSGIGPKGALSILSVLSADDLRFALLSGDAKAISKAPGVGYKTAQRVILELKDKVSLEDAFEQKSAHAAAAGPASGAASSVKNDAVLALTALGYSSSEALHAVAAVTITDDMDTEAVLKAAFKHLV